MDGKVTAGKIGGLFGNRGELTLVLYDRFPRDLDMEEPVFVEIDGHAVPLFFDRFARRGVRGATVVFADIDTPERAARFTGLEFFIRGEDRDEAPHIEYVVGWEAMLSTGQKGRITGYFESEHNPLLEVEIEGEPVLVPVAGEFIREINEKRRRVTFSLPEGLLGLNR